MNTMRVTLLVAVVACGVLSSAAAGDGLPGAHSRKLKGISVGTASVSASAVCDNLPEVVRDQCIAITSTSGTAAAEQADGTSNSFASLAGNTASADSEATASGENPLVIAGTTAAANGTTFSATTDSFSTQG